MKTFTVILPLLLSIAGFVLAMIALFAGSKPGQLEEFHIISINMSDFGHDLVPTATTGGSDPTSTGSGIGGFFSSLVASVASEIGDELNDIEGDIADKLSAELGISQWYSLHVMNACEGNYAPNATSPGAWFNTTNCTAQAAGFQFNITEVLDHEIVVGPLDLNPADLQLPDDITDAINYLNGFLLAIFVFFCLGSGFSGLSFLACIAALTKRTNSGFLALGNAILSGLAALTLMVGSAITTGVAKKGEAEINDKGSDAGISAKAGVKFIIIAWVSFAVMFIALIYWIAAGVTGRNKNKRSGVMREKHATRPSHDSTRPFWKRGRRSADV
ncbi:SUR7 protein [Xylariales sp. AK1849]|nr:SUR7 protein [Xylariales sp. AK1849]